MPAILLGIMTAAGGGMIRDISAGLVPRVFGGNNLIRDPGVPRRSSLVHTTGSWHGRIHRRVWSLQVKRRTSVGGGSCRPVSGPSLSHIRS